MTMENSNINIRSSPLIKSSSNPLQQLNINRKFLSYREFKDFQYLYDHVKRNLKSGNSVNSEQHTTNNLVNNNNENNNVVDTTNNNLVQYEHLSESWLELILGSTILGITILGVVLVGIILFIWIRRYFRETSKVKQCRFSVSSDKEKDKVKNNCIYKKKMNSRKWLAKKQQQEIESQVVSDLEQRLETVKFKNSPPTSPNNDKFTHEDDDDGDGNELIAEDDKQNQQKKIAECEAICESEILNENVAPITLNEEGAASVLIPCPLPVSDYHPQPTSPFLDVTTTSMTESKSPPSPLTMLSEEVHNVQPQLNKVYKSIATSPPPFSPIIHQHQNTFSKYATTGTQTYFTKAPNSPNNHLLNSQFAVLQTPTTSYVPSGNPFSSSTENKENKEPMTKRCMNKTITSLKQDNGNGSVGIATGGEKSSSIGGTGTGSSPSSPSSVVSTSPKILGEQNSPENKFSFSPKTASTNLSPSVPSSANYKFGNYFRFPDVGTPPVTAEKSSSMTFHRQQSASEYGDENSADQFKLNIMQSTDKESIILKIDEVESPVKSELTPTTTTSIAATRNMNNSGGNNNNNINNINNNNNYSSENTLTIRRARLKSISLDSDGARLVEENLTMPVEELVEMTTYKPSEEMTTDDISTTSANNNNDRFNPKNIFNLTINLRQDDNLLDTTTTSSDVNMNRPSSRPNEDDDDGETEDEICRTPTLKFFTNKKAVSLDSDNQEGGNRANKCQTTVSTETFNYYFGQSNSGKMNSSISVPSTPKHLSSNKLKVSQSEERSSSRYSQRKLGSFEETKLQTQTYKSNLTASIQTLNVSSSNLKTLPEISSISDFEGNQSPKTITIPPRPIGIPPSKSGILQRRGSNQSLTLNLNGSCGNLSRGLSCSNYSLGNIHGSHLNINQPRIVSTIKKSLLQRRGSNTSLTLNVQESNNNLNRFNSHSSLNIASGSRQGKGLLERRNSNASLTLNIQNRGLSISNSNLRGSECSLSSVNTNQMAEIMMMEQEHEETEEIKQQQQAQEASCHQRKFQSSESLHNLSVHSRTSHHRLTSHHTPYGSIDNLKHSQPYHHEKTHVICTKPLSPQTTSEDFKIYLANIQFLQSASNILNSESLTTLNKLFQSSYKNQPKVATNLNQVQFYNDDVLNSRIDFSASESTSQQKSPDEDQKEKLIKLHQEFWNLPTNYQEKPMVFGSQPKNRYKTILPNEHSRVILQKEDGFSQEPYINANFIKGPDYSTDSYIATQGPMQNTIYEFWLMVRQNIDKNDGKGVQKIAMLTDFIESSRHKCAAYFPSEVGDVSVFTNSPLSEDEHLVRSKVDQILHFDENDEIEIGISSFNYFVVKNISMKQKNGYSIRKLRIYYGNHRFQKPKEFEVYHYWFPDWPDHRSPEDIDVLLDLSLDLLDGNCERDFDESCEEFSDRHPLPIIHCSAGIGRTGCLAAILNGLGQIRSNTEEISVDILGIVCNLRLQRGGMVQNSEQYELIHRSICLFHHKMTTKLK